MVAKAHAVAIAQSRRHGGTCSIAQLLDCPPENDKVLIQFMSVEAEQFMSGEALGLQFMSVEGADQLSKFRKAQSRRHVRSRLPFREGTAQLARLLDCPVAKARAELSEIRKAMSRRHMWSRLPSRTGTAELAQLLDCPPENDIVLIQFVSVEAEQFMSVEALGLQFMSVEGVGKSESWWVASHGS